MRGHRFWHVFMPSSITMVMLFTAIGGTRMEIAGLGSGQAQPASAAAVGNCQVFPSNNFWNRAVTDLQVHASSSAWINTIGSTRGFHMDFGSGTWDGGPIGIPFNVVPGSQITKYSVDFYYPEESDAGPYPIPQSPAIEYGSDHHILTIDTDNCRLYELYDAWKTDGAWFAGSGAIWDLNSNALRPDGWTSADAAGLSMFPGLVRYEEVAAGAITHALRFTTNCTAGYYIWPARHVAQSGTCAQPVPFGARFRLKANYDLSGFSAHARVILQAMKTYGIVLADNGSPWFVSGAPNENWDNDVLHELDAVHGANFEAVDTGVWMVDPDSAETRAEPATSTLVVTAAGASDGWVLESTETSGVGGSLNSTTTTIRVGDEAGDQQYRGILSFDTSELPDTAVIANVTLKIRKQGLVGTNPFATHGALTAAIRKPYFGASIALANGDFRAAASASSGTAFGNMPVAGWYNATATSVVYPYINRTGTTQFRLRFTTDDNDDMGADYLRFYSGNAGAAYRPQLIVEYYVP